MKAADGTPIVERFTPEVEAEWYQRVKRIFTKHNSPDVPLKGRRLVKALNCTGKSLLKELSAAEERERVLREALEVMVGTVMLSDYFKRYEAFAQARAALATPAPEPAQKEHA